MVQIPNFLNTQNATPVLDQNQLDVGAAQQAGNQVVGAQANLLDQQMSEYNNYRQNATSAALIANEKQNILQSALPESLEKINEYGLRNTQIQAGIDEKLRQKQQKMSDAAYLIGAKSDLDTSIPVYAQQLGQQVPPNGSGYAVGMQTYLNNKINNLQQNAPSSDALMKVSAMALSKKDQAMTNAITYESKARTVDNLNTLHTSIKQYANLAGTNPEMADQIIDGLGDTYNAAVAMHLKPDEAQQVITEAKNQIRYSQINGLLNTRGVDPNTGKATYPKLDDAIAALNTPAIQQQLDPATARALQDSARAGKEAQLKDQYETTNDSLISAGLKSGKIDIHYPGAEKVVDNDFTQFSANVLANAKDPTDAANSLFGKVIEQPGVGPKTKSTIDAGVTLSNDPQVAALYSQLVGRLVSDGGNNGLATFGQLDSATIQKATLINQNIDAHMEPADAVKAANDQLQALKNPATTSELEGKLNDTKGPYDDKFYEGVLRNSYSGRGFFSNLFSTAPDKIDTGALTTAKGFFKQFYLANGGQQEPAVTQTIQAMQKGGWGLTYANGEKEFMKDAPESKLSGETLNDFYTGIFKGLQDQGLQLVSQPVIGSGNQPGTVYGSTNLPKVEDNPQYYKNAVFSIANGITGNAASRFLKGNVGSLPEELAYSGQNKTAYNPVTQGHPGFWIKDPANGQVKQLLLTPIPDVTNRQDASKELSYNLRDAVTGDKFMLPDGHYMKPYTFNTDQSAAQQQKDQIYGQLLSKQSTAQGYLINALNYAKQLFK